MKAIALVFILAIGWIANTRAQNFEHFTVEKSEYAWTLYANFEEKFEGVLGEWHYKEGYSDCFKAQLKEQVLKLSNDVRLKLTHIGTIYANFMFDEYGNIFRLNFVLMDNPPSTLSDAEWLSIYQAIKQVKLDMSQILLSKGFKSGVAGISLSNLINEAGS